MGHRHQQGDALSTPLSPRSVSPPRAGDRHLRRHDPLPSRIPRPSRRRPTALASRRRTASTSATTVATSRPATRRACGRLAPWGYIGSPMTRPTAGPPTAFWTTPVALLDWLACGERPLIVAVNFTARQSCRAACLGISSSRRRRWSHSAGLPPRVPTTRTPDSRERAHDRRAHVFRNAERDAVRLCNAIAGLQPDIRRSRWLRERPGLRVWMRATYAIARSPRRSRPAVRY